MVLESGEIIAIGIYCVLFTVSLLGLVLVGMINRQQVLEWRLKEAIKQFNVVSITRGNQLR